MPDSAPSPGTRAHGPERRRGASASPSGDRPTGPRSRDLVDRIPAAVFIQPLEVRAPATYVSDRIADLTGYTPDELLREREFLVRFMHEDDIAPALAEAERCDRTLEPFRARFRIRRRDGQLVWLQSEAEVVHGDDGAPLHWLGMVTDVTAEQEAVAALAESEARFRSIWESSEVGMVLLSPDGAWIDANRALCRMLGIGPEQAPGMTVRDIADADQAAASRASLARLAAGEIDHYQAERRLRRVDGSPLWARVTVSAVRDAGGALLHAVSQVEDITAEREAKAALATSEELFRSTFEEAAVGMAIEAPDGTILDANRAFCALFGHSPAEVRALTYREMLAGEHVAHAERQIARLMAGEIDAYTEERRFRRADGSLVWCAMNVAAVRDADGRPERMIVQVEDIDARKQAEASLAESEARFRSLFEGAATGLAVLDAEGRCLDPNPALCAMLGRDREWLLGRPFAEVTYPGDADGHAALHARLMSGEIDQYRLELRLLRPAGAVAWARLNVSAMAGGDGARQAILQVEDIDAMRRAQAGLERSEARFRALVQRSSDVVMVTRPGEGLAWISPAIRSLVGWEPELPDPGLLARLVHPEDREAVERTVRELHRADDGGAAAVEFRIRRLDGSWRWVEARGASQLDNPDIAGVVWNVRDIEEHKAAERAMADALALQRQATADLEALERQRSDFLAMLAHDFRTPLTAIQGYAELVAFERPDDPDVVASARTISESAQRLNRMVRDMLTVETLEQRLDQLALEPTDANALVARAVEALRGAWPGREIGRDLAADLPAVALDRDQATQAVTNLVANALKYSPEREPVTVRTRLAGDAVEIAVEDHGFGIPADRLDAVFDKYARVRSAETRSVEGLGLGLPIVRAVARAHGGDVRAESTPGRGSTFRLLLPLRPRGDAEAPSMGLTDWHPPASPDQAAAG